MKTTISLALLALCLVSKNARASPAVVAQGVMSTFGQINSIYDGFQKYINDEAPEPPMEEVRALLHKVIPCPTREAAVSCAASNYNFWLCGYSNCGPTYSPEATTEVTIAPDAMDAMESSDVMKCANALEPDNVCRYYVDCIPDTLQALAFGMNPKEVLSECAAQRLMTNMSLIYQEELFTDNYGLVFDSLLEGNTELPLDVKEKLKNAVRGYGCRLPEKNSCFVDILKFKMCLMNICVYSMSEVTA